MSETEGTIQFAYDLREGRVPWDETITELAAWRDILFKLDLIGQSADLYGGYAYGNLSVRPSPETSERFIITASQTSGAATLQDDHLTEIIGVNLPRFWVEASGIEPPSSETLSHAMIYSAEPRARFVFHVHSATLWRAREALGLPETPADVPYGSPAMTQAVADLLAQHQSRPLLFATAGHEDGIFSFGMHAREAGGLLVTYLAKAISLGLTSPAGADE